MVIVNIIAIHGTFASDAIWPQPNGILDTAIKKELGDGQFETNWLTYGWSGANSHFEREKGAFKLAAKIATLPPRSQENLNILLGHSHGGNIALMSLLSTGESRKKIDAVVCLSTPFLVANNRDDPATAIDFNVGSWLVSLVGGLAIILATDTFGPYWLIATALFIIWIGLSAAAFYSMRSIFANISNHHAAAHYDYFRISARVLALRTKLDEVLLVLRGLSHLGGVLTVVSFGAGFLFVAFIGVRLLLVGVKFPAADAIGGVLLEILILSPPILVTFQALRALIRKLALGEDPISGMTLNFKTVARLDNLENFEENVVVDFSKAHRFRFRFNHSALHSREETAKPIASLIRSLRSDVDRARTVVRKNKGDSPALLNFLVWVINYFGDVPWLVALILLGIATALGSSIAELLINDNRSGLEIVSISCFGLLAFALCAAFSRNAVKLSILLATPFSFILLLRAAVERSLTWIEALGIVYSNLAAALTFIGIFSLVKAVLNHAIRPTGARPDYVASTSEWVSRCQVRLIELNQFGSFETLDVAERFSRDPNLRVQMPEDVAEDYIHKQAKI